MAVTGSDALPKFEVVVTPSATSGPSFPVSVTGTDGTNVSGTAISPAALAAAAPSLSPGDYTASVDLGNGNTVQIGSNGIIAPDGSTANITDPPEQFNVNVQNSDALTNEAVFSFEGLNDSLSISSYQAVVSSGGKFLVVNGGSSPTTSNSVSFAAQILGTQADGYEVVIVDPTAPLGKQYSVTVTSKSGQPVDSGIAVNQPEVPSQAIFSFAGPSTQTALADLVATVTLPGNNGKPQILKIVGDTVESGPPGVTGYITSYSSISHNPKTGINSSGVVLTNAYQVVINDPFVPVGETFDVSVVLLPSNSVLARGTVTNEPSLATQIVFPFTGVNASLGAGDYQAIVTSNGNAVATIQGSTVSSTATGVTGFILGNQTDGYEAVVDDPSGALGQSYSFNVTVAGTSQQVQKGTATNQVALLTQAAFPFTGSGLNPDAYIATVGVGGSENLVIQGGVVLSGPAGATGYITPSPTGGYTLIIDDYAAALGQVFDVTVTLASTGKPVAVGTAVNQALTPSQAVFPFQGTGDNVPLSSYVAEVTIGSTPLTTATGSAQPYRPQQAYAYITGNQSDGYEVVVSDPSLAIGATVSFKVLNKATGQTVQSGTAINQAIVPTQAIYPFLDAGNPLGSGDNYSATVSLPDRQTLTISGGTSTSTIPGVTGYITGEKGAYYVVINDYETPIGTPFGVAVTGPNGYNSTGTTTNQLFTPTQAAFPVSGSTANLSQPNTYQVAMQLGTIGYQARLAFTTDYGSSISRPGGNAFPLFIPPTLLTGFNAVPLPANIEFYTKVLPFYDFAGGYIVGNQNVGYQVMFLDKFRGAYDVLPIDVNIASASGSNPVVSGSAIKIVGAGVGAEPFATVFGVQGSNFAGASGSAKGDPVFSFTDPNDVNPVASDFAAALQLPDGELVEAGSQGIFGPDGVTGQIVGGANNTFTVQINDPAAAPGQSFPVTITGADGFTATGTAINVATYTFNDTTTPNAPASDFTATVNAGSHTFNVGSAGVSNGQTGDAADLVADPNGGYDVHVYNLGSQAGTTTSTQLTVPLPNGGTQQVNFTFPPNTTSETYVGGNLDLNIAGVDIQGGFSFTETTTVTGTVTTNKIVIGGAGVHLFVGANGGTSSATGLSVDGASLAMVVYQTTDSANAANDSTTYALDASSGNVSLQGVNGLTLGGTFDFRYNDTGKAINETIKVPGIAAPVSLVFSSVSNVDAITGSLALTIDGFARVSGSYAAQETTSTDANNVTSTQILLGISGLTAFVGDPGTGNNDQTGLTVTGGQMGLVLDQTGSAASTYALYASGNAALVGISGLTLSAQQVTLRKNTTGGAVSQKIATPAGSVAVNFTAGEGNLTSIGGVLTLGVAGIVSLTGDFGFSEITSTSGTQTTTKILVGASGVSGFFGANGTGVNLKGGTLGLAVYRTADSANPASDSTTYALDANSGDISLQGVSGLTLSGSVDVRVNNTGNAINEKITVPGVATPVPLTFTSAANVQSFGGTMDLKVGGYIDISGGFSFGQSSITSGTATTTTLQIAASNANVFAGTTDGGSQIGLQIQNTSLALEVFETQDTALTTQAPSTYALAVGGSVSLVGLSPVVLSGTFNALANSTGNDINTTLSVPNLAGGAALSVPLKVSKGTALQFTGSNVMLGVANVFQIGGNFTVTSQTDGTLAVNIQNAGLSLYLNQQPVVTLGGSASFSLGGVNGFQLNSFSVGGVAFATTASDGTVTPAPTASNPPTTMATSLGAINNLSGSASSGGSTGGASNGGSGISDPSISLSNFHLGTPDVSSQSLPLSATVTLGVGTASIGSGGFTASISNLSGSFGFNASLGLHAVSFTPSGAWSLKAGSITATLGSFLTIQGAGLSVNPLATATQDLVSLTSASATLSAGSLTVTGSVSGFAIEGNGSFLAKNNFAVSLNLNTASSLGVPAFIPIQSLNVTAQWPGNSFNTDPSKLDLIVSAVVNGSIGPINLSGSISNMVIDVSKLADGQFPIDSVGSFAIKAGGDLFGVGIVNGAFILGIANFTSEGASFLPVRLFPATPVASCTAESRPASPSKGRLARPSRWASPVPASCRPTLRPMPPSRFRSRLWNWMDFMGESSLMRRRCLH